MPFEMADLSRQRNQELLAQPATNGDEPADLRRPANGFMSVSPRADKAGQPDNQEMRHMLLATTRQQAHFTSGQKQEAL